MAETDLAFMGFQGAFARFEDALRVGSTDDLAVSATEATLWLVAIDEWRKRQGGPYVQMRDRDPGGWTLRGLRWARNQGVHNLVAAHRRTGGVRFPMSFPAVFTMYLVWESPSSLPALSMDQPENAERYLALVGREVRETFLEVTEFLAKVK